MTVDRTVISLIKLWSVVTSTIAILVKAVLEKSKTVYIDITTTLQTCKAAFAAFASNEDDVLLVTPL
jgi:hypothetical protein